MTPPNDQMTLDNQMQVLVQLSEIRGQLNQVILDHERRLVDQADDISRMQTTQASQGLQIATLTANSTTHTGQINELFTRSTGAVGKTMSVISGVVAGAALLIGILKF